MFATQATVRPHWSVIVQSLGPGLEERLFPLADRCRAHPRRLAASAALISPASTDNTTRTLSSTGTFNRRDLATGSAPSRLDGLGA